MPLPTDEKALALGKDLLQALDNLFGGPYPGYRAVHAKGALLTGTFAPTPEAASLTRAPHATRSSTPVSVRFPTLPAFPRFPTTIRREPVHAAAPSASIWLSTCTPILSVTPPMGSRRAQRKNFLSSSAPLRQAVHPCLTQRRWNYSSADILPHWPSCKCRSHFQRASPRSISSLSTPSNSRMPTDLSATVATASSRKSVPNTSKLTPPLLRRPITSLMSCSTESQPDLSGSRYLCSFPRKVILSMTPPSNGPKIAGS